MLYPLNSNCYCCPLFLHLSGAAPTTRQPMQNPRQQTPSTSRMISDDPFVDDFGDDDDFDEVMLQGIEEIELQQGNTISNTTGIYVTSRVPRYGRFMWFTGAPNFEFCNVSRVHLKLCDPETLNSKISMSKH